MADDPAAPGAGGNLSAEIDSGPPHAARIRNCQITSRPPDPEPVGNRQIDAYGAVARRP